MGGGHPRPWKALKPGSPLPGTSHHRRGLIFCLTMLLSKPGAAVTTWQNQIHDRPAAASSARRRRRRRSSSSAAALIASRRRLAAPWASLASWCSSSSSVSVGGAVIRDPTLAALQPWPHQCAGARLVLIHRYTQCSDSWLCLLTPDQGWPLPLVSDRNG